MNIINKNEVIISILIMVSGWCIFWLTADMQLPLRIFPISLYWFLQSYGLHKFLVNTGIKKKVMK